MKPWHKALASGATAAAIAATLVVHFESGGQTINRAYFDKLGQVWTICDGHTAGVKAGDYATDKQCEAYRRADLAAAEAAVDRCITAELTTGQRAAFIDAALNLGPGVLCGSTLQRLANGGDVVGACLQLTDAADRKGRVRGWTMAGGAEQAGLRARRTEERNLCIGYAN